MHELHQNEIAELKISPHPIVFFWWYLLSVLLIGSFFSTRFGIPEQITMFTGGAGVLLLVLVEILRRATKYYVTNQRVIHEFVFFVKKSSSATHSRIQDVHLSQSFIGRLLNVGNVYVNTGGTAEIEITLKGVHRPASVRAVIERHIMHAHNPEY